MRGRAVAAAALLACAAALSCFSPQEPACAFSCARGKTCPQGWSCGDDGLCHDPKSRGRCDLDPVTDGGDAGGQ